MDENNPLLDLLEENKSGIDLLKNTGNQKTEEFSKPKPLGTIEEIDELDTENLTKEQVDYIYKRALFYSTNSKKTIFDVDSKKQAAKYFEIAANAGNSKAAYNMALCYLNGDGVEKNEEKALEYFEKSPNDKIFIEGISKIADKNVKNNKSVAIKLYKIVVKKYREIGDTIKVIEYSLKISPNSNKVNKEITEKPTNKQIDKNKKNKTSILLEDKYKREFKNIESKLNKDNNKEMYYSLAYHYLNGIGVEKNEEKALEYFEKSPDDEFFIEGISKIADKNIESNKPLAIKLYKIVMNKYDKINNSIKNKELRIKLNILEGITTEEKIVNKELTEKML